MRIQFLSFFSSLVGEKSACAVGTRHFLDGAPTPRRRAGGRLPRLDARVPLRREAPARQKHGAGRDARVMLVTAVHDSLRPTRGASKRLQASVRVGARAAKRRKATVCRCSSSIGPTCVSKTAGVFFFFASSRGGWRLRGYDRAAHRRRPSRRVSRRLSLLKIKLKTQGGSSEGERVCDHHAAQLVSCRLPPRAHPEGHRAREGARNRRRSRDPRGERRRSPP